MICLVFQLAKFAYLLLTFIMFVYTLGLLHKTRSVFLDVFLIWGYLFKFKWHPQRLKKEIFDFCENVDLSDIWQLTWGYHRITSYRICKNVVDNTKENIIHNSCDVSFSETHLQVQTHVRMQETKKNVNRCPRQPHPHIIFLCCPFETQINGN